MHRITLKTLVTFSTLSALFAACVNESGLEPTSQATTANARLQADVPNLTLRRGKFIIISNTESLPANLAAEVVKANGQLTQTMGIAGAATATSTDPNFAQKAARIAGVRSVIPDYEAQFIKPVKEVTDESALAEAAGSNPTDDPLFALQWGHKAISSPQAWAAGYQGAGARVAVLDGGFDLDHPDLVANIVYSKSFVPGEGAQYALPGAGSHGTHTAGTVAALDNNIGVVGVAPKANLLLIKVLRDSGSGSFSWLLQGVLDAVAQKADIVSMSLGAYVLRNGKYLDDNGTPNNPSDDFIGHDAKGTQELITLMTRVMNYANRQGVTLIAAAGNDGVDGNKDGSGLSLPANLPNVLSISATGPLGWAANQATSLDRFASYSNYGTPDVSFAAPGGDFMFPGSDFCSVAGRVNYCYAFDLVLSTGNGTSPTGNYYFSAGTSMACPHAAGVAALIVGKNGGPMDPARVEAALRASADDLGKTGRDPYYGYGRVNAFKAVTSF